MTTGTVADLAEHVARGGLIAFPTETVWSLSCQAHDVAAVKRLRQSKARPESVPLALGLVAWELAAPLVHVTPDAERLARSLPGPVSIVLDRRTSAGDPYGHLAPGLETLSIRVPDHPAARTILLSAGPLVMTSANTHEEPDPTTTAEVEAALGDDVLVLEDASVPGTASTVVDCRVGMRVLRQGAFRVD